jgi:hypothetical protein
MRRARTAGPAVDSGRLGRLRIPTSGVRPCPPNRTRPTTRPPAWSTHPHMTQPRQRRVDLPGRRHAGHAPPIGGSGVSTAQAVDTPMTGGRATAWLPQHCHRRCPFDGRVVLASSRHARHEPLILRPRELTSRKVDSRRYAGLRGRDRTRLGSWRVDLARGQLATKLKLSRRAQRGVSTVGVVDSAYHEVQAGLWQPRVSTVREVDSRRASAAGAADSRRRKRGLVHRCRRVDRPGGSTRTPRAATADGLHFVGRQVDLLDSRHARVMADRLGLGLWRVDPSGGRLGWLRRIGWGS